VPFLK